MLDRDPELAGLRRLAGRVGASESAAVPPIRRTITGGDVPLNLVDWGAPRPDARTVLFVHGAQLTARTWDGVCLLLRDTYRCLALDLRGHGDSGWSGERRYGLLNVCCFDPDGLRDDHVRILSDLAPAVAVAVHTFLERNQGKIPYPEKAEG